MPNSHNLVILQEVVAKEKAEIEARRQAFAVLTKKMKAFSKGSGPTPTLDEIVQWRESAAVVTFEKDISSGFIPL